MQMFEKRRTHSVHPAQTFMWSNLKFPQTEVLLRGSNQFHLKHLKQGEVCYQQETAPPPFFLRKIICSWRAPDQNALPEPLTISTYWHYSKLAEEKKNK